MIAAGMAGSTRSRWGIMRWFASSRQDFMPSKISLIIISDSNFADLVRWAELYLTRADVPFPFEKYQNIKELALKKFSFRNLNRSPRLSTGAVTRPVEALYQDVRDQARLPSGC